jgi:transposase
MAREPYKTYSKEFKIEAVRLAEKSDKPVTQVARELGVRQNQIYKWKKQLETHSSKAFPGKGREVDDETARLRRELAAAKEEIDILKKAAAYFAKNLR